MLVVLMMVNTMATVVVGGMVEYLCFVMVDYCYRIRGWRRDDGL
jgi:hypothetical protein